MIKKPIVLATLSMLFSALSHADTLGVYAGTGNWKPEFKGNFQDGTTQIGLGSGTNSLNIEEKNQTNFYIALEHPIPFLPNFKLATLDLESGGSGTFNQVVNFGGQNFTINDTLVSSFDLSHQDFVFYYELLDNWVNLDLGLTLRKFDGFVTLTSQNNASDTATETFDETIPMLYGKARFDLPLTGLSFNADINYISASGDTVTDTAFYVGYETSVGLGIEGGVRTFSLEVDDANDLSADLDFEGAFVHVTFHF